MFGNQKLKLQYSDQAAKYLENRLAMRKFDLGIASAPLGASFLLLETIRKVDNFWLDVCLTVAVSCFVATALISVVQIHRFSRALGKIRSVLAQSNSNSGCLEFRTGIGGLNRAEILLNGLGYTIIVGFLLREIWEVCL